MPTEKTYEFALKNIVELEYKYINPITQFGPIEKEEKLEANLVVNYKWNIEKELFGVALDFLYSRKIKEENHQILKLSILNQFSIKELSKYFKAKAADDFEMDKELETTLVSISISTGRGILYEKTKGTPLNSFYFPIVDPKKVILSPQLKGNQAE